MSAKLLREATEVAVRSYADGARTHKDAEPRRKQWLRIRDALRAVVDAGLLVDPIGENAAYNSGYRDGLVDGRTPGGDTIVEVWVHHEHPSEDPLRTFYEIPDKIAVMVRDAGVVDGENFASCLHNMALEHAAAKAEIKRLKRLCKSDGKMLGRVMPGGSDG